MEAEIKAEIPGIDQVISEYACVSSSNLPNMEVYVAFHQALIQARVT